MALFNFGKKKEEKKACCCSCNCAAEETTIANECCGEAISNISCVKVLGAGCAACHQQYEYVKEAVNNIGLTIDVEYITDMQKIMEYGVMSMPAIVVNEKVVSAGKVLKPEDVKKLLKK